MGIENIRNMLNRAYDTQAERIGIAGDKRRAEYASTTNRRNLISGLKGSLANASIRNAQAKADELTNEQMANLDAQRMKSNTDLAYKEMDLEEAEKARKLQREQAQQQMISNIFGGLGGVAGVLYSGAKGLSGNADIGYEPVDLMPEGSGSVNVPSDGYGEENTFLQNEPVTAKIKKRGN